MVELSKNSTLGCADEEKSGSVAKIIFLQFEAIMIGS